MKAEHVNPFIQTLLYVLETTAQIKAEISRPFLKKTPSSSGPLSGLMEVSGDKKGFVSLTFSEDAILAVVSNMFGEKVSEINDEVKDAVGEIVNMVCGQANNKFAEQGINLKVVSHGIKEGDEHFLPNIEQRPFMSIPVKSDSGDLFIEVSIEE